MTASSFVFFMSSIGCESLRDISVEYWDGRDELEVRAGAFRRPRGSLRWPVRSKIDPVMRQLATFQGAGLETIKPQEGWLRARSYQELHVSAYHSGLPCSISWAGPQHSRIHSRSRPSPVQRTTSICPLKVPAAGLSLRL